MKSFFEYCDSQDKKFYETTGSMIGKTVFGTKAVGGKVGDTLVDVIKYIISCIGQEPSQAKLGLKRMAGGNKGLQNELDSILHDDMSITSLGSRLQSLLDDLNTDKDTDQDMQSSSGGMKSSEEDEMDHMA